MTRETQNVRARQEPLRERYREAPEEASITDRGRTTGGTDLDPFHGVAVPGSRDYGVELAFGIHRAVGGYHDAPNPGDLLCTALAACLDSTIRMIADRFGVTLETLEVDVAADVDVRGTLVVERDVPVGFQSMACHVDVQPADGTDPERVRRILEAAEYSCVNLQTLLSGVPVETTLDVDADEPRSD